MLSYQHAFHCGNHADVLKHYVLSFVLSYLNKKEKPYTFFDTHSGSSLYDLSDSRILKTSEAENGILKLLRNKSFPNEISLYLNCVKKYLEKGFYPGSPEIERFFLRSQDFLILSELHPQEIENLRYNISHPLLKLENSPKIQIHNRSGWEMIKALTPPSTKRGGILIDPSYEELQDYIDAEETICKINKKWSSGIIMLWYPLLFHRKEQIQKMLSSIKESVLNVNKNTEILNLQLLVNSENSHKEKSLQSILKDDDKKNPPRLYGSGMLVINAPWHLKEESDLVINYLTETFFEKRNS